MYATIICKTREDSNYIYDLLVSNVRGENSLKGSKMCIEPFEQVDDVMIFDLTEKEIEDLKKLPQVLDVRTNDVFEVSYFNYTKKSITGYPKLATSNPPNNTQLLSHSLLYCQDYALKFTQDDNNGKKQMTLSTIDCSNVDIIVIDSGVDGTHPDLTDDNNNPLLVQFNWALLTEPDPNNPNKSVKIINSLPADYYSRGDSGGHGTACASLVAGKRCGFARNAKIYSLNSSALPTTNINGQTVGGATNALKLELAFLKAKKRNLHGLNSSRPTVLTNSWGTGGLHPINKNVSSNISKSTDLKIGNGHINYVRCIGSGENTNPNAVTVGDDIMQQNFTWDSLVREIIKEGGHFVRAAGNANNYYDLSIQPFRVHRFVAQAGQSSFLLGLLDEGQTFKAEQTYGSIYKYSSTLPLFAYASPDIGINLNTNLPYSRSEYPIIIVGCVTPIGDTNETDSNYYASGGSSVSVYNALQKNKEDQRIKLTKNERYISRKGPFFVKSPYSNFGPSVDIYAPGNGAWAAKSSQYSFTGPTYTVNGGVYKFFNGTSSACPIVAGILATYLSQNPTATPTQSKNWLLNNAVRGNIMETTKTELPVKIINISGKSEDRKVAYGSNTSNASKINNLAQKYSYNQNQSASFKTLTIDDILFLNRFFDTNNLFVQAFPLRKAVLANESNTVVVAGTTLTKAKSTTEVVTHTT